jgi:flagellar biosynthetic protein FliR
VSDLINDLSALLAMAEALAWAAVLVFLRVGAMVALMPGFGEQTVPQRIKLSIVIALTLVIAPIVAETPGLPSPALITLGGEAVSGLILGIGMRLFLLALQTAAVIVAQAATLSQLFAGATPDPQPAIGNLFIVAGIALALSAGLHLHAAELVLLSYDVLPAGGLHDPAAAADWNLGLVSRTFSLAFTLAAPFIIASMIYNLALGAINRAMPQLMVSMVGAPALTLGALALLAVATPALLAVWLHAFEAYLADPFGPMR